MTRFIATVRKYPRSFAYVMFWTAILIGLTIWSWTTIGWWALLILPGCVVGSVIADRVQKWAARRDEADQ